ncbi:MAG: metallophosphoesterase, partial [Rhodospirillales bacterium]|nr:metallophosphoesterase [Rhodospirillales bacterium]
MSPPTIPTTVPLGAALRVVGDVHGDDAAFAYATATDRFVIQLGDLVDHGPRSDLVLARMFALIDTGRGLFLLGNHDHRLARALEGNLPRIEGETARTLGQLDPALAARARLELARAPLWLRDGGRVFVHAGFHTAMADAPPETLGGQRPAGIAARALFGEPT